MDEKYNTETTNGVLLIIGNGFDLDLGYPTSYHDYYKSVLDPCTGNTPFGMNNKHSELAKYLLSKYTIDSWFDLENALAAFGESMTDNNSDEQLAFNKSDYESLCRSLTTYLKTLDYSNPNNDSVAANLIRHFNKRNRIGVVYSFNFTDLVANVKKIGIDVTAPHHIHGSIINDDIILGAGDYALLDKEYAFLYKSCHYYKYHRLIKDLECYKDVIIFGLSLSKTDYPYFEDFFKKLTKGELGSVRIRIFTKDESSENDIMWNLRQMNPNISKLRGYSDFQVFKTACDKDAPLINEYLSSLNPFRIHL